MSEVDKAMDSVEQHDLYGQREVPIAHARVLAAEVRRLRAMLDVTPDARELALALAEGVWERNTLYVGARNQWLVYSAPLIAAHDARLLDEAAERGVQKLLKLICEDPIKPWIEGKEELRDAIKGLAE